MRTEAEIRKELAKTLASPTAGCGCRDCEGNRVAAEVLKWVLGEKEMDPYLAENRDAIIAARRKLG